jgi:hypothetical protein
VAHRDLVRTQLGDLRLEPSSCLGDRVAVKRRQVEAAASRAVAQPASSGLASRTAISPPPIPTLRNVSSGPMTDDVDTVDALLARSDEGWAWFREAIHALPQDAWDDEVAGGGWTRRKMLNHVRVWHELTASRLATFHETGTVPPLEEDVDSINARAAADADVRSSELIVTDLDRSYADVRKAIGQLTDRELTQADHWAPNVVAGNTFGHYEEHRSDLEVE